MTDSERTPYLPAGALPAPVASPDGVDAPFWEATRRHELAVQRCEACSTFQFEPEAICRACRSAVRWEPVEPRGRIFSWIRVHHAGRPELATGTPYLVVLVELPAAGNVRVVGNLLGNPDVDPVIGAEVDAVFEDHADGDYTLVQWRLTGLDREGS
jgi:uncharacterized OB-fold protein